MKKTLHGLLASFITVFGTVLSLYPWDVWRWMPVFRPHARTSRLRRWMIDGRPRRPQIPLQN
jgi:hypothetical protein